jgi:hypothetical protein
MSAVNDCRLFAASSKRTAALNKYGASLIQFPIAEGKTVPVCGQTGRLALRSASLLQTVRDRQVSLPIQGRLHYYKLTDERLADVLLYFYGDEPKVIAEAIIALRKAKSKKAKWVKRVLWGYSQLRNLAQKVHSELTGV